MAGPPVVDTLADLSRAQAAALPGDVAMVFEGRETSYGALDRRANQVAGGFADERLSRGARVALLAKNTDTYYEILLGASKAGAVLVPVNWRLAPAEIAFIVNDSGAELMIVGAEFTGLVEDLRAELNSIGRVLALDGGHRAWPSFDDWRAGQSEVPPAAAARSGDVVVQMYTSGTTGDPKGARLTNGNICAELRAGYAAIQWRDDDVSLIVMPQFHIAGTVWGAYGLFAGIRNVVMRDVDPAAVIELTARERITKLFLVPAVILFMLQRPEVGDADFSSLRLIVYGASPIAQDLLRRAIAVFKCGFCQVYGLTETTGAITYLPPADHHADDGARLLSCGKPYPSVEFRIVDADDNELPAGEIGEVATRSPMNMVGYWNLPEATDAALRGGWFHTGDAGYLDEDGYLYIHDRIQDMIISGGENVYPAEVENALFSHPAVADVAVIGVPDETWGEAVKAIVVKAPDAETSEDELVAHTRDRIAHFKAPRSVDFVAELPRNPSGKILKRELRKPYWQGKERQV